MAKPVKSAKSNPVRRSLLAKIHLAKKQLGLSEEHYRAIVAGVGGVESCADLTLDELGEVLAQLEKLGFEPRQSESLSPRSRDKERKSQSDRLVALWINLYQAGAVKNRSHQALQEFVLKFLGKNVTILPGVDPLEALSWRQKQRAIGALEKWLDKAKNPPASGIPLDKGG